MDTAKISRAQRLWLAIRLSSLGDVLLVRNALDQLPDDLQVDFIVSASLAPLVAGHARVRKVIPFDRKRGLTAWLKVIIEIRRLGRVYEGGLDLHRSLRSWVLRWLTVDRIRWASIGKDRLRLELYFFLKTTTPKCLRPRPVSLRLLDVFRKAGIYEQESHDTSPVKRASVSLRASTGAAGTPPTTHRGVSSSESERRVEIALAPGSLWRGKEWPLESFQELGRRLLARGHRVVVVGGPGERSALSLLQFLKAGSAAGSNVEDAVGVLSLTELEVRFTKLNLLVGNDSGLAHLAEGVGVPVVTVFGPTKPDQGFGPSLPQSRAVQSTLWCSPCSKGGERCFRVGKSRFLCIREVSVDQVWDQVCELLQAQDELGLKSSS